VQGRLERTNEELTMTVKELKMTNKEKENLIGELQKTMKEVKQLHGIVPMCSTCKKIRNDKGFWEQVEKYVEEHSKAQFSHGFCPDCFGKFYGKDGIDKVGR